jgi:hypothetical protein
MNSMTKYLMNNLKYDSGTSNRGQGIFDTYDPTDATILAQCIIAHIGITSPSVH